MLAPHRISKHFDSRNMLREAYLGIALEVAVESYSFLIKIIDVVRWPQPCQSAVEVSHFASKAVVTLGWSNDRSEGGFLSYFKHPMPQTPVYPQPLFHICSSLTNTLLCLVYLFGILCTVCGGCLWFGTAWWYGYMLWGVGVVVVRHRLRSYSAVPFLNLPFSCIVFAWCCR